jgi:hypothetical protein
MSEDPIRDPNTDTKEQLQILRDRMSALAAVTDALQKSYLATQIQQVKNDVDAKWATFKIASGIGALVLTLFGVIGYHSLQDLKVQAISEVRADVKDSKEFYDDLMSGAALNAQQNYGAAVPRLMHCFKNGHEYDKSVLLPLLTDLNMTDDWEEAAPVVARIRSDQRRYDDINDATVYTVVGSLLVQSGLSAWARDPNPETPLKNMEDGASILKDAIGITPPGAARTRMLAYQNLWIYYVARRQFDTSQTYIDSLKKLPDDVGVYSWIGLRTWRCMRDLKVRDPQAFDRAERQWIELFPLPWKRLKSCLIRIRSETAEIWRAARLYASLL